MGALRSIRKGALESQLDRDRAKLSGLLADRANGKRVSEDTLRMYTSAVAYAERELDQIGRAQTQEDSEGPTHKRNNQRELDRAVRELSSLEQQYSELDSNTAKRVELEQQRAAHIRAKFCESLDSPQVKQLSFTHWAVLLLLSACIGFEYYAIGDLFSATPLHRFNYTPVLVLVALGFVLRRAEISMTRLQKIHQAFGQTVPSLGHALLCFAAMPLWLTTLVFVFYKGTTLGEAVVKGTLWLTSLVVALSVHPRDVEP